MVSRADGLEVSAGEGSDDCTLAQSSCLEEDGGVGELVLATEPRAFTAWSSPSLLLDGVIRLLRMPRVPSMNVRMSSTLIAVPIDPAMSSMVRYSLRRQSARCECKARL